MTELKETPLRRKTAALYRGRALVVRLHPRYLEIGEERHQLFAVPYDALYETALRLQARRNEEERRRA